MSDLFVRLDDGTAERRRIYRRPVRLFVAQTPDEALKALDGMRRALRDGLHLAGYASYELGHALEPKLRRLAPARPIAPYLMFGAFEGFRFEHGPPPPPAAPARVTHARPLISRAAYRPKFQRVIDYILAGDVYQVNLTFPIWIKTQGAPMDLYAAVRQRQKTAAWGGVVNLGAPMALSWSPELFFRVDPEGCIRARPMKGTIRRGAAPEEDEALKAFLKADPKNRAENLMIVDLLRNDIGRLSRIGSVRVGDLFTVETYDTLHTMTSGVEGRLKGTQDVEGLFRALFPCGSVTGAPKIRAMEIIHEIEGRPRGLYCGAMGWMGPDGSAAFNVAIRTLLLRPDGQGLYAVGGGIVADSEADSEYDEALLKARFLIAGAKLEES